MKKTIGFTLAAMTFVIGSTFAKAADVVWPTRPVQVIVPAGAGGDTDFNARQMARYFEKITGKPMVVTNVNGGGGTIAMSQVQGAAPDGNTLFFGHTGQLIVNEVSGLTDYKFDAKFDISCIAAVDKSVVLVAGKKAGVKDVKDVVAKGKAAPNSVIYGTELGGYSHLQGLIFQKQAGIQMKFVDVGSASDKITSLLGGRIHLASISYGPVKDYQTTGDMAMVGQYNKARNPLLGDIKTFNEQGMKFDMEKPYIVAFPKGTNPAIIQKMSDVMAQITKDPAYAKALEEGFKQPVAFYPTKEAITELNEVRNEYMQYKDLLRQKQ
ncbi:MAG: protein TctC [Proteobacteria bacterium]|nr:protein TctC [Pseudomonadota bacterium]